MINKTVYPVQHPLLQPYITDYWILDFSSSSGSLEIKLPPLGFPVLQIHFGGESNFYNHRRLLYQSVFVGQLTRHVLLKPSADVKFVAVNFKPYGLCNLFGISPLMFQDSSIKSYSFFKKEDIEVCAASFQSFPDRQTSIALLETILASYRVPEVKANSCLDSLVDKIVEEHGLIQPFDFLPEQVNARQVQRYFREHVGVSMKRFCQILRHKFILEQLRRNPNLAWQDLALKGFYEDSSHFEKDFIEFSENTPANYLSVCHTFSEQLLRCSG
ncbi:MAG: AraC family transcriptional regulator [Bacteroidia bacterium]|nr:AraC family transcriptional regulator [Bacteroidia bacterium]